MTEQIETYWGKTPDPETRTAASYAQELEGIVLRLLDGETPTCRCCTLSGIPVFGDPCEICDDPRGTP